MSNTGIERTTLADGRLQLAAGRCSFTYERVRPGVLRVVVEGSDKGQFGTAALDEIRLELLRHRPLELFIDAEAAQMVTVDVNREWTQFFSLNREHLTRVSVLVGSKALELTVAIAQHLSRTGNLLQIYSDRELFETRLAAARG